MLGKDPEVEAFLKAALKEDVGARDLTSSVLPEGATVRADAVFKEPAVLCGIEIAERLFRMVDGDIRFLPAAKDGEKIEPGRVLFYVEGPCRSVLAAERTALNFLGRMSGVATLTSKFVEAVEGTRAQILDTRKTTPLFRKFDRYAVKTGGGQNHRFGLFDGVLLKDNHLKILKGRRFGDILKAVRQKVSQKTSVGIEVRDLKEAEEAFGSWFDYILLDNFSVDQVKQAVALRTKMSTNIALEVSGNIRLDNVRAYAETGVERISVGALTHSAKTADVSLNII